MISPAHFGRVLNKLTWTLFWVLMTVVFYGHTYAGWWIWVLLFFSLLLAWKSVNAAWTFWLYGRHQAELRRKSYTPSDRFGRAGFATLEELENDDSV